MAPSPIVRTWNFRKSTLATRSIECEPPEIRNEAIIRSIPVKMTVAERNITDVSPTASCLKTINALGLRRSARIHKRTDSGRGNVLSVKRSSRIRERAGNLFRPGARFLGDGPVNNDQPNTLSKIADNKSNYDELALTCSETGNAISAKRRFRDRTKSRWYSVTRFLECERLDDESPELRVGSDRNRSIPLKRRAVDDIVDESSKRKTLIREWFHQKDSNMLKHQASPRTLNRIEYPDRITNSKWSVTRKYCPVNQLPPEVLCIIFMKLSPADRLCSRLVCRYWLDCCSILPVQITVRTKKARSTSKFLRRSAFQRLEFTLFAQFPLYVWKNIGVKITTLNLNVGSVRRPVVRSIIKHCENLRHLSLDVGCGSARWLLFDNLPRVKFVRPGLETFQICSYNWTNKNEDFVKWRRVLWNLLRVYPNIVTFKVQVTMTIICDFSRAPNVTYNPLTMASYFARMLSGIWRKALPKLEILRLTSVKLHLNRQSYTQRDVKSLWNFFCTHNELRSVDLNLNVRSNWNSGYGKMLTSVYDSIKDNCELRQLNYCRDAYPPTNWLYDPRLHGANRAIKNAEDVSIGNLSLSRSVNLELRHCRWDKSGLHVARIVPKYAHVLHLTLVYPVSAVVFQSIFKYMTELKTLKMKIDQYTTEYALFGRPSRATKVVGYSINRLQHLERLEIVGFKYDGEGHNTLCSELNLPKLNQLRCWAPKLRRDLMQMAKNLPSLKTIIFDRSNIDLMHYKNFCRLSNNLHTLDVRNCEFRVDQVKELFQVCSSLRIIHTKLGVDYTH